MIDVANCHSLPATRIEGGFHARQAMTWLQIDRLPALAADLVCRRVAVIAVALGCLLLPASRVLLAVDPLHDDRRSIARRDRCTLGAMFLGSGRCGCSRPKEKNGEGRITILDKGMLMPVQISSSYWYPLLARVRRNVFIQEPRRRAGSSGGKRRGANGARSTCRAAPSMISSLIASPVAGALSMPQTLWPVAT
jgi:hypothetical protein